MQYAVSFVVMSCVRSIPFLVVRGARCWAAMTLHVGMVV